ncbi:MAG: DNA polymerase Y family protein [Tepidisphaeraceae bacterium]
MKQVMCVHLPNWPIDRLRRRRAELRRKAFVLVETTAHRQIVTAVSPEVPPAVRPGMTLAQARAHCADLAVAPAEPEKDRRSLEALGYWLMRFSPNVAIWPPSSAEALPNAVCLDATGLEMLFGNLHALAGRVDAAMKRLGLNANVAIAPTPGAAWAMAVFGGKSPLIVSDENLVVALSRLPPEALRLEVEGFASTSATAQSLHALGIGDIGILLRIPRDQLVSRFGPAILQRIGQATGAIHEPLNWLPHRTPIQAEMEFDGIVESLQTIHLALRQVLDRVVESLTGRGLGAKQLRMTLRRPYAPPIEKTIGLLRSSRNAASLFILLRHALESVETDDGFHAVGLSVISAERLGDEQTALIGDDAGRNAAELDHLIERLRAKFGDVAEWAELVEAHVPELAFSYGRVGVPAHSGKQSVGGYAHPTRPLCLLPIPCKIPVIVMPSESRDGQPVAFMHDDVEGFASTQVHRLVHVRGPERIAGQWWNGSGKTRDYFDVADTAGSRFWLFRVMETNQWYLHGIFE